MACTPRQAAHRANAEAATSTAKYGATRVPAAIDQRPRVAQRVRGNRVRNSSDDVQDKELPEEPKRAVGPERQRQQCMPIGREACVHGCHAEGRIDGERDHGDNTQDIGNAKPQHAIAHEGQVRLAGEAWPHKQAREEKHQRHEVDVLPRAEQIESQKTVTVDDRKGTPIVGRAVEADLRRRNPAHIGQRRMETQHDEDDDASQVIERQAGARSGVGAAGTCIELPPRPSSLCGISRTVAKDLNKLELPSH